MKLNTYKADVVELSYIDLLGGLSADLATDDCMPAEDRKKAMELVNKLYNILEKYSA